MALRKHHSNDNAHDDDAVGDRDDEDDFSLSLLPAESTRGKRRRERENKLNPKEMTEEEMMDLALRLSKQEASITASRLQKEEEAMRKAVQESMGSQTQLCSPSQSQSLLTDGDASLRICSRRKLLFSNGKRTSAIDQGAVEIDCPPETDLNQANETAEENQTRDKKRKRKEGSPLPDMPDLSQTQTSPCSSESLSVALASPQSSDSTQIDDCQLHKSPVFPPTGRRAKVHIPRLSQELLETCKTTGFVLCSQDSCTSTQKPLPAQPRSPTFPQSPRNLPARPKSPVFSETDQGDDGETEPEFVKSPVFGRNTQHEKSPRACRSHHCENPGSTPSSQESFTSAVRCTAHQPGSPVFPKSPVLSKNLTSRERTAARKSPVFSETKSHGCWTSSVLDRTGQHQQIDPDVGRSCGDPSAATCARSNCESNSPAHSSQIPNQEGKTDSKITTLSKSDGAPTLNDASKDCSSAETHLRSSMTLLWSDEDDDDTPVGSPSPVFPEERPTNPNRPAAAPETTNCRQQLPATEPQPVRSQGAVRKPLAPSTGGPTVHYYWGVPFCPRGLDPDSYTQVILAQMEVYEKSLKQAQRTLLRKAEWGEPILPQPEKSPSPESQAESPQRLIPQRVRRKRGSEAADASPAETEEGEDVNEAGKEDDNMEEDKNEGEDGEERRVDTDACDVCPETQLSDSDSTQDLTVVPDNGSQRESRELPEIELILRGASPAVEQQRVEVDSHADGKTRRNVLGKKDETEKKWKNKDAEEDQGRSQRWTSEPEAAAGPQRTESTLDCPICQQSFPVTEIEVHAAYCDGEVDDRRPKADTFQTSLKPRRKRTRRADVTDEVTNSNCHTGRNQEKCYICQKAVDVRDYSHHTELCIQRRVSKPDAKETLLSALEQTESRDSEAGPSKLQPGDVIDLRDDDDEGETAAFEISNSPIRCFTPISEATDCLIDFARQRRAKKPIRRRR